MKYGLLSGLVLAACWHRPVPPTPDRVVTVGVEPASFALDNGLRVVLVPDPRATQVSVTVVYAVGAADDPVGSEGLAHLAEHVLYEPVVDGESLLTRLQKRALDFNGFTRADTTTYTAHAWPDQLGELLAIETTRLDQRCASLTDDAFVHAREIVRNELRERDGSSQLQARLDAAIFPPGHPYHRDAPTLATVGAITRDQACAFADAHYGTNNAVLIVSGPIQRAQLESLLQATLGHVRRDVARGEKAAAPVARTHERIEVPLSSPAVVIGWPMPSDPVESTRVAAVVKMFAADISTQINGSTSLAEIGGPRGALEAIVLRPNAGTSVDDLLGGAERGRAMTWYGTALFEASRGRAVFDVVDGFDDGLQRDSWIAEQVFAGRDPQQTLQARVAALHAMTMDRAGSVARSLPFDGATIVTLVPDPQAHAEATSVTPPIHEMPHNRTADPAAAATPMPPGTRDALPDVRMRTLPSGLRVVLAPVTSVRTFDARIIFPIGTAQELPGHRGVALLAARGLAMNRDDQPLLLRFLANGGAFDVAVERDHIDIGVRGLASNLDQTVSTLAHLVGNGFYPDLAATSDELKREASLDTSDVHATRLWRGALYGEQHPYVDAGLWKRASKLTVDEVFAFRSTYFVPKGATLVITGGFDPDLAERWIDYAFAEWHGESPPAHVIPSQMAPLAFAQSRASSQIAFRVAFPVQGLDRARALVVAEMVSQAVGDVRESLAASYGVSAVIDDSRSGTVLLLGGRVDAARAAEAFGLIRDRIEQLRRSTPQTASRFVDARAQVVDQLESIPSGASSLGAWISDTIAHGRSPADDHVTANAVRALTFDQLRPALKALDLMNAAMMTIGPEAATNAAYNALGREPAWLH